MAKRKVENKTIEVILLQADKHLGEKFEIVKVKPIFARNILLPNNIAVLADTANKNMYAQKMKAAEEHRKKKASDLEDLFMKIQNDNGLVITKKANKDNTLYAKVDESDICSAIASAYGIEVDTHLFKLKKKINAVGSYNVPFLYKEIKKDVVVNVVAEKEAKKEEKAE
ncbi:TPA: 50S ribosomal protein L9 [Patescibacteria group bacterium]|nr:50S ribosomal protein L9 [Candidatus Gracilibacteria bacterium]